MIRNLAVVMGFALLFTVQASAQQDPQLTQWFNDPAAFNIGAAGETDLTHVNAWYRNQWMGVNGAPVTTMLNLHTKVDFVPGALGVQLYQDEIGQESNTMVKLGYAYHLSPLSNGAHVGIGLNVSLFSKSFDANWIAVDGVANDPAIPDGGASGTSTDVDFGIFMRKGKEYYAGISATHLAEVQMSSLSIVPTRHFYFMGGYNYPLEWRRLGVAFERVGQNRPERHCDRPQRQRALQRLCVGWLELPPRRRHRPHGRHPTQRVQERRHHREHPGVQVGLLLRRNHERTPHVQHRVP